MAYKTEVQEGDRLLFSEILDALGETQRAIAKAADVTPPWLSQVLKGQRKKVDGDMLERVANVFVDGLMTLRGNSRFTTERIQILLASLSRFTAKAAAGVAPKFYPPGGLVAVDAAHYITREPDKELLDAVQKMMAFTTLVEGPTHSGKSSLLARLQHKAHEVGFKTAWFDPTVVSQPQTTEDAIHVQATAAMSLARLLQEQWGLAPPTDGTIDSIRQVVNWLSKELALTASTPRLLILDDLSALGANAAKDWLSHFVRPMHNKRATGGPQVSLAVGFTHLYEVDFGGNPLPVSSVVHWWPMVEVRWFTEAEVRRLESVITGSPTSDDLFELFGGQPYLSHAAIANPKFRDAVRSWNREPSEDNAAAVRSQPYKRHRSAILYEILGRTNTSDAESLKVLGAFSDACLGEVPSNPDLELFLETQARLIKVVSKRGKKISGPMLELYRLVADDLMESVEK